MLKIGEPWPAWLAISLQRWTGQFWSGQWEHQMYLTVPTTRSGKATSSEAVDADAEADEETAETTNNGSKIKKT